MPVTMTIEEDEITAALERMGAALANPTPLMQDLGEYLIESTKARFRNGKAPDGSIWAAKSPVTLARYPGSTAPLIGESKTLSQNIFALAYADRVEWGSDRVYAAVQQFGAAAGSLGFYSGVDKNGRSFSGVSPWGDIPARPFLGISAEDQTNVLDIIGDYLSTSVGEPL